MLLGVGLTIQIGPEFTSCNIKGNISYSAGEKIYHVPGQEYYSETRIACSRASAGSNNLAVSFKKCNSRPVPAGVTRWSRR